MSLLVNMNSKNPVGRIKNILANLHSDTTHLELNLSELLGRANELDIILSSISVKGIELNLKIDEQFSDKPTVEQFKKILQALPPAINALVINWDSVKHFSPVQLQNVLKYIPLSIESLRLHQTTNTIWDFDPETRKAFAALPEWVKKFTLQVFSSDLKIEKDEDDIVSSNLPSQLTELDYSLGFNDKCIPVLNQLTKQIPTLNSINLSENRFGRHHFEYLKDFLQNQNIDNINLSYNSLNCLNNPEQLFQLFSKTLKGLDLSGNKLEDALISCLQCLQSDLEYIGLSGNNLHEMTETGLTLLLQSLPKTLISVDLSNNSLRSTFSKEELKRSFLNLHATVSTVDLRGNNLGVKDIEKILPDTVNKVRLDDGWVNRSDILKEKIVDVSKNHAVNSKKRRLHAFFQFLGADSQINGAKFLESIKSIDNLNELRQKTIAYIEDPLQQNGGNDVHSFRTMLLQGMLKPDHTELEKVASDFDSHLANLKSRWNIDSNTPQKDSILDSIQLIS